MPEEKKIGIAGGAGSPDSAGLTFDPHTVTVGTRIDQFGGTSWIVAHKTATRLYLASEHIFALIKFGDNVNYVGSNLQQKAREFNKIFNDYEKSWLVVNPDNGDLIGPMSRAQLDGGFSYFNSNSRRVCDTQLYWTSTLCGSGDVWGVNTNGSFRSFYYPDNTYGFRPFVCLSL